jgi:hypothetical protein
MKHINNEGSIPDWVGWTAQDENGAWWGYQVEPLQHDCGWYENEVGRYTKLAEEDPNPEWRNTLRKIDAV